MTQLFEQMQQQQFHPEVAETFAKIREALLRQAAVEQEREEPSNGDDTSRD